ncbi:hypothetical protein B0H16DRAFT_1533896 [Mycena metata]|uniref:F-box domain-containing protein n=1 Tax=Mycena metata TaxID=1033252 RepID=A0AAD7JAC1_9AGAR|nr:hypothetical protein B0H16DRAFT_1533896 [Mycena metata]
MESHLSLVQPIELTSKRLEHLICSNDVPLPQEIPFLEKILAIQRNGVARLQTQLSLLPNDANRGQLELELQAAELNALKHAAILSILRWFPAELICEIMAHTLPHMKTIDSYTTAPEAPWWLGHICRRWRAIALGYSPLWSSFGLCGIRDEMDRISPPTALEMQLQLTGSESPLDITLIWKRYDATADSSSLDLLLTQSARWRSFRLELGWNTPDYFIPTVLHGIKGRLPLLRTLECISARHRTASLFGDVFADLPNLRELRFTDADVEGADRDESPPPSVNVPWRQITHFRGRYRTLDDGFAILRAAPNLVECGLTINQWHPDHDPAYAPLAPAQIELLCLRRLSTRCYPPNLLGRLTIPALQELWITFPEAASLLSCIERSSAYQLVTLVVYQCAGDVAPTLVPILRVLPDLTTIFLEFLDGRNATRDIFDALAVKNRSALQLDLNPLCPALSRFAVGDLTASHINPFLDMVQSRITSNADTVQKLTFVRAYSNLYRYAWPEDAVSRVGRMHEAGLDIRLDSGFRTVFEAGYMHRGRP